MAFLKFIKHKKYFPTNFEYYITIVRPNIYRISDYMLSIVIYTSEQVNVIKT